MPAAKPTPSKILPTLPPRLKPGDTLGIAAPSGPFETALFTRGLGVLQDMGFKLKVPGEVYRQNGFLAGPDALRAQVLNRLFADPEVQGIICARGGYGAGRMAAHLDWPLIRANPKAFVGFSDITVLHHLIGRHGGLVTFHGPMVTTLAEAPEAARAAFLRALTGEEPLVVQPEAARVIRPGKAQGPVLGGNLTLFGHLLGTPLQPATDGRILFFEDIGEAPYRIDRLLWQLKLAGCFEGVKGVVFGSFTDCGAAADVAAVIDVAFQDSPFPVVAGFPVGHGPDNITLPHGLPGRLETDPPRLSWASAATRPAGD
jgi:muramoyltetrapeptide carboxypeptidase